MTCERNAFKEFFHPPVVVGNAEPLLHVLVVNNLHFLLFNRYMPISPQVCSYTKSSNSITFTKCPLNKIKMLSKVSEALLKSFCIINFSTLSFCHSVSLSCKLLTANLQVIQFFQPTNHYSFSLLHK